MQQREIRIRGEDVGRDILNLLSPRLINESKTRLRRLVASGRIRINGNVVSTSARVSEGDCVSLPADIDAGPPPSVSLLLDVLYEDGEHLAINKPPGRPVLTRGSGEDSCLYEALVALLNRDAPAGGPYVRPHLVHRLDRDTSGVLLVAKNERAGRALSLQFQSRLVRKTYLAVVEGVLPRSELTVEIPLRRSASRIPAVTAGGKSGKHAVTQVALRKAFGHFSLLEIRARTGRQHQVRVHLAAVGYPLAVDSTYGRRDRLTGAEFNEIVRTRKVRPDSVLLDRCPLHAQAIAYRHPASGCPMEISVPMPPDMEEFLSLLEKIDSKPGAPGGRQRRPRA